MNTKPSMTIIRFATLATLMFLALPGVNRADSVLGSKHDLSAAGPGPIKAVMESGVCIFCHTPHRSTGDIPLWNHTMSGVTNYVLFNSPTFSAAVGEPQQPDGASRLCLSCHDGTVAVGMINSRAAAITMANGIGTLGSAGSSASLGTDLSGHHPISFVYSQTLVNRLVGTDAALNPPTALNGKVKLDANDKLQCTACHNAHDNQFGNFLVMDNTGSALCLACHTINSWGASAHALSPKLVPQNTVAPSAATKARPAISQPTIASRGCENCHATHFAGAGQSLLTSAVLEENCYTCHDGGLDTKNIAGDFQKFSVHPITVNARSHQPQEDPVNPKQRHVTCMDCHNPHAAKNTPGNPTTLAGSLLGVTGVDENGAVVKDMLQGYQLCFRCHGDSIARRIVFLSRQYSETNLRLKFYLSNDSFHPVETIGKSRFVPSLIAPWTPASTMDCIDCHNNDESPAAGGIGANGPHGSLYKPLLERQMTFSDFNPENPAAYALCYKCHSRDSILANQSFPYHSKHIVDDQTSCSTCHDPHGVPNSTRLINFNTSLVTASSNGQLSYANTGSAGTYKGVCSLTCHGKDHINLSY